MIRALWFVAALAWAGLSVPGLRGLTGEIYRFAANASSDDVPSRSFTGQALAIATRVSPWMPDLWKQRAYRAGTAWDRRQMLAFSREALRWAPADSRLWMSHVNLLVYAGIKDRNLEAALERLRQLAPASPHIHLSKALLGIQVWRHSPDFFRRETLDSARFMLQNQPRFFYRRLTDERLDFLACALVGADLDLNPWCAVMQRERQRCDLPNLEPSLLARCRVMGLHP